jgi:hypothetical protein
MDSPAASTVCMGYLFTPNRKRESPNPPTDPGRETAGGTLLMFPHP